MDELFEYTTCGASSLVLQPGLYEIEVWGAEGGLSGGGAQGGKGGYCKGELTLKESTQVFLHIGAKGQNEFNSGSSTQLSASCNGGGSGTDQGSSGGGSTDFRILRDDLYHRLLVGGGGGGSGDYSSEPGGFGGGAKGGDGQNSIYSGKGANQNGETIGCGLGSSLTDCPKGIFGFGGNATVLKSGGGGGGFYGGSASCGNDGGGGGSGYVFTSTSIKPTGYLSDSKYYLTNTIIKGGDESFINPSHSTIEPGHSGNGAIRIFRKTPLQTPQSTIEPSMRATPQNSLAKTPQPTMMATNYVIPPKEKFVFTNQAGTKVVHDSHGKFFFSSLDHFDAIVPPGLYLIYANASFCGFSVMAETRFLENSKLSLELTRDIQVFQNSKQILYVPGHMANSVPVFSKQVDIIVSYDLSHYICNSAPSTVTILYTGFNSKSCAQDARFKITPLLYFLYCLILLK